MNNILVDHPGRVDAYERTIFARYLLDTAMRIDVAQGAVIGLEGKWGSGKTWVLKQMQALTEDLKDEKPIFVEFNPWMLSGAESMVEALLVQLAAQVGATSEDKTAAATKIAESILAYANTLSLLSHLAPAAEVVYPGAGSMLALIGATGKGAGIVQKTLLSLFRTLRAKTSTLSLPDRKRAVADALERLSCRIIVLVDDLDRLPPQELAAVIQTVKAVADFPKILYVLSYDPKVAASSLRSSLKIRDGRAFLEKIIQMPLPVPPIPASIIKKTFEPRLEDCISRFCKNLSDEEHADLKVGKRRAAALLETPRDLSRLETRLAIALPKLHPEINAADLLVAEALLLKRHALMEWQEAHPDVLVVVRLLHIDEALHDRGLLEADRWADKKANEEAKDKLKGEWRALLGRTPQEEATARMAIGFLFDAEKVWGSEARSNYRRLQEFHHWYRWRCFTTHHEPWDVSEIAEYLREPKRLDQDGITGDLERLRDFVPLAVRMAENDCKEADSEGIAHAMIAVEATFSDFDTFLAFQGAGILSLIVATLRLDNPSRRASAFQYVVEKGSLRLALALLRRADKDAKAADEDIPKEKRLAEYEYSNNILKAIWIRRAQDAIRAIDFLRPKSNEPSLYWLAVTLLQMGTASEDLRTSIGGALNGHPERLPHVFAGLRGDGPPEELRWEILPSAGELKSLGDQFPSFQSSHSTLWSIIKNEAARTASS